VSLTEINKVCVHCTFKTRLFVLIAHNPNLLGPNLLGKRRWPVVQGPRGGAEGCEPDRNQQSLCSLHFQNWTVCVD